jgi:hypothetical protein
MKRKLPALLSGVLLLGITACTGGTYDGYVHAECDPTVTTADGKVTVCRSTEKPLPTATVTVTPSQTATPTPTVTPTPTPTVTPTVTPTPTPTPTPTAACGTAANPGALSLPSGDQRRFMHGMDIVKHDGKWMVVYSSNNYPPTSPSGDWIHNVFYSYVDACNAAATFAAKTLWAATNAQEPASAAVNSSGRVAVTVEDAAINPETLDQTVRLWGPGLTALKGTTQLMPPQGGHSGHVAAVGSRFGVAFSDGWVDGGGVDGLGTGEKVFFRGFDENGNTGVLTEVGSQRDWWPVIAGSDESYLQVWQRYGTAGTGGGKVMGAIIGTDGHILKPAFDIFPNNKYYYHDVQWIPSIQRYLVVGSQNSTTNAGVAVLLDKAGNVVSTKSGLPNTIREGQTVVNDAGTKAVYPGGTGAVVLDVTATGVTLAKQVPLSWNWSYMGTDGVFADAGTVVFATGTQQGVKFLNVKIG